MVNYGRSASFDGLKGSQVWLTIPAFLGLTLGRGATIRVQECLERK